MAKAPAKTTSTASKTAKDTKEKTAKVAASSETKKMAAKPKKTVTATAKVKKETSKRCGGKTCKIQNCAAEYKSKGYCKAHYKAWRNGKYGVARYKVCSDIACRTPMAQNRHGFCEQHYQNYFVKGMEQAKIVAPAPAEKAADKDKAATAA